MSVFSTFSFRKLVFCLSVLYDFRLFYLEFDVCNICVIIVYSYQVFCDFVLTKELLIKDSCFYFKQTICKNMKVVFKKKDAFREA